MEETRETIRMLVKKIIPQNANLGGKKDLN
jgi:hypothetical protein